MGGERAKQRSSEAQVAGLAQIAHVHWPNSYISLKLHMCVVSNSRCRRYEWHACASVQQVLGRPMRFVGGSPWHLMKTHENSGALSTLRQGYGSSHNTTHNTTRRAHNPQHDPARPQPTTRPGAPTTRRESVISHRIFIRTTTVCATSSVQFIL